VSIPEIIERSLGVQWVWCGTHEKQKVVRLATGREVISMILGIDLPEPAVTDRPPF
jgi:hypothetical protein